MEGTLVLLSGGLDSSTLLAQTIAVESGSMAAVSVNYGQRHVRELESARQVAEWYAVPWSVLDLSVLAGHLPSALTGKGPVPEGHYTEATMAATVVPNRNAIMLMCAVGIAAGKGLTRVVTAVHAGDHAIYPDCRPDFIHSASRTAMLATRGFGSVSIEAPFVEMTKAGIVKLGNELAVPFMLSWSCYRGDKFHCGRCGTCVERAEAFHLAGVPDPTRYEDPDFWRLATGA